MNFKEAFEEMKKGNDVKLPGWKGFWRWDNKKKTIMMYCKNGKIVNVFDTEQYEYTLQNLASDEFIIATEENCPLKGGKIRLDFNTAMEYAFRGFKVSYHHEDFDKAGYYVQRNKDEDFEFGGAGYYVRTSKDCFLELKKNSEDYSRFYVPCKTDYESTEWYILED